MADIETYLARVTGAHSDKPKFMAMLDLCLRPMVEAQDLVASFVADFDLDQAIGAQLDVVGKWIGRSRLVETPIRDPWFRFGESARGLGRGIWKDRYSPGTTLTRLDDDTYRRLLRAKIVANNWDGTRGAAEAAIRTFINQPDARVWLDERPDIGDALCCSGHWLPLVFCFMLEQNQIPVKVAGARRSYYFVSVDRSPMFGFGVDNDFISGLGVGAWGVSARWLLDNAG